MSNYATVFYVRDQVKRQWNIHRVGIPLGAPVSITLLIYGFEKKPVLKIKELAASTNESITKLSEKEALSVNNLLHSALQELMPETSFIVLGIKPKGTP